MRHLRIASIVAASIVSSAILLAADPAPLSQPAAPKRPVTNTYWGVEVIDEYQILEDVTDPEVVRWAG